MDRHGAIRMTGLQAREFRKEAGIAVRHVANVENDWASAVHMRERPLEFVRARKIVFTVQLDSFDRRIMQLVQRAATILLTRDVIQATLAWRVWPAIFSGKAAVLAAVMKS